MKLHCLFLCAMALVMSVAQQTAAAPGGYRNGYGLSRRSPLVAPSAAHRGRAHNVKKTGKIHSNSHSYSSSRSNSSCQPLPIRVSPHFERVTTVIEFDGLKPELQWYDINIRTADGGAQTELTQELGSQLSKISFNTKNISPYVAGDSLLITLTEKKHKE